jgi:hypothetical protein
MFPGVDMLGGLENMTRMVENEEYDNQYDFVVDLYRLINVKPREGHMGYQPALISAVSFETPVIFISISEDGLALPQVYLYQDYLAGITARFQPSPVESYEGMPIVAWLEQRSVNNDGSQDPDAAYNTQVWSAPLENIGQARLPVRVNHGNLSDSSTLVFTNGSSIEVQNYAILRGDWTGISSGLDVHRRFEVPGRSGQPRSQPLADRIGPPRDLPDLQGYPDPLVKHSDNYLSAYLFGDDEGTLSNTAVIAVKSFVTDESSTDPDADMVEFASVINDFVSDSERAGANRLIIDFQGNGGGTVGNLVSLYNVLFPRDDIWLTMRARHNDVLDWMGTTAEANRVNMREFFPFNPAEMLDEDKKAFSNWADFYTGEDILGDTFTNLFQPMVVALVTDLPNVLGSAMHPQHFDPANTVIVTDGYCASACAIAVGLMSRVLGIRTVAMGGRPIEAPMQAIGGTKGGPVVSLDTAQGVFQEINLREEHPDSLDAGTFYSYSPLAGPPPSTFVINTANVHLHDDNDGTPVQFLYEAANCKLFYTWETLTNMTLLWSAVANVEWNGAPCVAGSTANDDNTISDDVVPFSQSVVSNFTWVEGPGDVSDRPPVGELSGGGGEGGNGGSGGGGGGGGSQDDNGNAAPRLGVSLSGLVTLAAAVALFF